MVVVTVTSVNDAPNVFSLTSPADGAEVDTLNPYLTWEEAINVDVGDSVWYVVRVSADSSMSSTIREETVASLFWRVDQGLEASSQYFWDVCAIDRDSAIIYCQNIFEFNTSSMATRVEQAGSMFAPKEFALCQNYPNPFNPETIIKYQLPSAVDVTIKVYNIFGQEIATLVQGQKDAGYYSVVWNATGMASGVYFCTIEAGNFRETKKMLLLQ